jgi:hypothetical protein
VARSTRAGGDKPRPYGRALTHLGGRRVPVAQPAHSLLACGVLNLRDSCPANLMSHADYSSRKSSIAGGVSSRPGNSRSSASKVQRPSVRRSWTMLGMATTIRRSP